jgi:hypothetical protein
MNQGVKLAALARAGAVIITAVCVADGVATALINAGLLISSSGDSGSGGGTREPKQALCGGSRGEKIPTLYVFESIIPQTARHIADAQLEAQPPILTRTENQRLHTENRRKAKLKAKATLGPAPAGMWIDEYPFASTLQGGNDPSVRHVRDWEQFAVQGPDIKRFYRQAKLTEGKKFRVQVVPNF